MHFPNGGSYTTNVVEESNRLTGLVDMHTHPVAHLGFGTELFYGAPDGDPATVFHNCNPFHGGVGLFDNPRGNEFRRVLVDKMQSKEGEPGWDHKRNGYPNFPAWPSWHDRLHQQMWIDWIRRAWEGGLRVLVCLAVNNHTLADAAETQGPYDDLTSGNAQINELKAFIGRHSDFMQAAYSSLELRNIVSSGKLAMVLGVELDCIGNFYRPDNEHHSSAPFHPNPTAAEVLTEIDRLFAMGVRYVFPIHITDNIFGGAAVYDRSFTIANRFTFGKHYVVEAAPASSGIGYVHAKEADFFANLANWAVLGKSYWDDFPAVPPTATGHRNARGLTDLGRIAVEHLMKLGMMIDVDHMSERTVEMVLEIAERINYPLCAGHTGVRGPSGNERLHTRETLKRMYDLGGLWGIGLAGGLGPFADALRTLKEQIGSRYLCAAIGSDACGLEHLPGPRFKGQNYNRAADRRGSGMVVYRDNLEAPPNALKRCVTGSRSWDYSTEGFMHYGLLPDMLEEAWSSRILNADSLGCLFRSAEGFAQMWEGCSLAPIDGMVTLRSWFSPDRKDNLLTSHPYWAGQFGDERDGYTLFRYEGRAFDARREQPPGTVPLFTWWNETRGDNFSSTDPAWSMDLQSIQWEGDEIANGRSQDGYRLFRLEGFIYDPNGVQVPGTRPLLSWWSEGSQDNFATSAKAWSVDLALVERDGPKIINGPQQLDHQLYRLEGYVVAR